MQQVAVEPIGFQARERMLAGRDGTCPRCVFWYHLGDQEDISAAACDGFADNILRLAIVPGCVDVGHAEIKPPSQGGHSGATVSLIDIPGTLPDNRYLHGRWAEAPPLHPNFPCNRSLGCALPSTRAGKQPDDLRIERRDVIRTAARHQTLVDDDLLVDPIGAGVLEIGLQRRPRGYAPAARRAGLDDGPGSVANCSDR